MNCCCAGWGGDSFLEKALVSTITTGKELLGPSRAIPHILEKKRYFDGKVLPLKKLHEKPKPRLSPLEHWRKGRWARSSSGTPGKPPEQSLPHVPHPCCLTSPFSPCQSAAEMSNVLGWRGSGHPLLLSRWSVGFGTCLGHTFLLALLVSSPPLHAQPSQPSLLI